MNQKRRYRFVTNVLTEKFILVHFPLRHLLNEKIMFISCVLAAASKEGLGPVYSIYIPIYIVINNNTNVQRDIRL